ncbi:MAG TPA: CGNR zinc finger domain-containing protein [Gaiellaceae bacterium]
MARYDVPKAAPEPLRAVQQFINSADVENGVDWLPDWLERYSLGGELERARELREALRALALANNVAPLDAAAVAVVNDAAARLSLELDPRGRIGVRADGSELDRILAVVFGAMLDGSWERLKACRNCRWSFYDYSPNRSATWCSMQLCGNRKKTRAYRRRKAGG